MHTLVPALALRDGRPWLVFGSEGGHGQTQTHSQVLTRIVVDGDDPQAAIRRRGSGRSRHLRASRSRTTSTPAWIDDLRGRGHDIASCPAYDGTGHAHAIECLEQATAPAPTRGPKAASPGL